MKQTVFTINKRFSVHTQKNTIQDHTTGVLHHIEPRIMRLLYLLKEQKDEVVSRDFIIKEIWNNYPGANEGLNQAISFLRKVLDDEKKELIHTIPKTGYCFRGAVSSDFKAEQFEWRRTSILTLALVFIFLLVLAGWYSFHRAAGDSRTIDQNRDAVISNLDSAHQAEMEKRYNKDSHSDH